MTDITASYQAVLEARAKIDAAEKEGRDLTAEEQSFVGKALDDADAMHANEVQTEQKSRLDKLAHEWASTVNKPMTKGEDLDGDSDPLSSRQYKKDFEHWVKTGQKTDSMRQTQEYLQKAGQWAEAATTTLYGAVVPRDFVDEIAEILFNFTPVLGLSRVLDVNSNLVDIPQVTAHGVGSATAYAEAATVTEATDPTTARTTITVFKYGAGTRVSNELLADSAFPMEQVVAQELGGQVATQLNTDLTVGTGTNHTWGFMSTHATKVFTTAATNAFTADELFGVRDAIIAPYWRNATWHVNQAVYRSLSILKDSQNRYLLGDLANFGGLSNGGGYQLLGNPLTLNPDVVGTTSLTTGQKFIAFADLTKGYYVCRRPTMSLVRSDDRYFDTDEVGFRLVMRYGADVVDPAAVAIGKTA